MSCNSKEPQKPFFHTELKSSLENIVFNNKAVNGKAPLENIFADKSSTLKAGVKALLDEIELRENLNTHLLNKIDNGICREKNLIENIRISYSPESSKDIASMKLQLENNLLNLREEKRKEYLECWRDLMVLKKYLMMSLREYWDLVKRREVLEGD